ncbi:MAG TPA: amino acid adenylation domain-containing protein [Bacteroidales bacterium]|nr:amino acid adenylation domain-containing protein [Bacteroidales bacterium]
MFNFKNTIIDPLLDQIRNNSQNKSFCINREFFTYKELGESISKIRQYIIEKNIDDKLIGLVANDDLDTYASIFALWLEGKAYVPLHPNQPLERCMKIVEQVSINYIFDSSQKTRYTENFVVNTRSLHYTRELLEYKDDILDSELAYILFTSGSTGDPKGVTMSRENISAFMDSFWDSGITVNSDDKCLQCFDLTFDVSIQCYLSALTKGACCYTVPHGEIKYLYVSNLIDEHKLTVVVMAPSMLRYMEPYFNEIDVSSIKYCILTAEACPLNLIEKWFTYAKNVQVFDFYGPTEATIYCTYYKLNRNAKNKSVNGIVSIGNPMKNVHAIIVNENNEIVDFGEKGELCVAGAQITPGYYRNKERNDTSFFYKNVDGKDCRFYRTGDLCYQEPEGNIMYIGRIDNQVKIQGYRVELGEIEFYARQYLDKINAVAIAFENSVRTIEICLFIESKEFDKTELSKHLSNNLPAYMLPSVYYFLEKLPINNSEKIDKIKLKKLIENA